MCTVTYIPSTNGCYLTSSRDENAAREEAVAPALYEHKGTLLACPKDAKAGGSWIAVTQTGNAAVLLNGAFEKHIATAPYRKSRGIVLLDIIAHPQPGICFLEMDLDRIEPFTVILFIKDLLFEGRWDGQQKHFVQLDEVISHIWSSATLYTPVIVDKRKQWFELWVTVTGSPTADDIFNFHRFAGDGDQANSVLMNRNDGMLTVSITGIEMNTQGTGMRYFDVKADIIKELALLFEPVTLNG